MKPLFTLLLLFIYTFTFAQQENPEFQQTARQEDSLMMVAYDNKDVAAYHQHLDVLLAQYKTLTPDQQRYYEGNILGAYYNLACTYALTGNKKKALDYLELSKYSDYAHLLKDTDLDAIRGEKRFKKCLAFAKGQTVDYLQLLKKAQKFEPSFQPQIPAFTYQAADNPHLASLRKAFNLDSIAGTGNEVSRILNLLHWIHNLIPHDGNHGNPEVKNAMNMIAVCKKEARGLNCRGLATVLNECYLSMGIPSRFVTCLPKDSADQDCHVINMVYARSLQKWIWIDPTWDAYVMDEKGNLLGIEEVRYRLIHDKTLIINPDANWNHRASASKEGYLSEYMAKNLYRLECPVSSEYDFETAVKGKMRNYTALIPADYYPLMKYEQARRDRPQFKVNYTGNAAAFWAVPE
jgi:Transglutaminase-like superfamily